MIDADTVLEEWRAGGTPEARAAAEAFLSDKGKGRRFILGCNAYGRALAQTFDIEAFIDTVNPDPAPFEGHQVFNAGRVPADALIVNSVLMAKPRMAIKAMAAIPAAGHLNATDLLRLDEAVAPLPDFVAESREDVAANADEWAWLYGVLEDAESRRTLDDIVRFRLTADPNALDRHGFRPNEQYFDPVVPLDRSHALADVGAYDGDTTEQFIRRCPNYARVHLFEPSEANFFAAQKRLHGARSIHFHQCGVSDKPGVLRFADGAGSASMVSEEGDIEIPVTTLDEAVTEPLTFIKMDIEGWEGQALEGAKGHVTTNKPVLTIAAYHRPSDFWRLPRRILSYDAQYDISLRHYTEGWTESVLYATSRS